MKSPGLFATVIRELQPTRQHQQKVASEQQCLLLLMHNTHLISLLGLTMKCSTTVLVGSIFFPFRLNLGLSQPNNRL